jgi:hypothetical protein
VFDETPNSDAQNQGGAPLTPTFSEIEASHDRDYDTGQCTKRPPPGYGVATHGTGKRRIDEHEDHISIHGIKSFVSTSTLCQ